tara:strand:+ start:1360 stop:1764 length:405 start_codon:yes stop_codon:yes gene_type:complete
MKDKDQLSPSDTAYVKELAKAVNKHTDRKERLTTLVNDRLMNALCMYLKDFHDKNGHLNQIPPLTIDSVIEDKVKSIGFYDLVSEEDMLSIDMPVSFIHLQKWSGRIGVKSTDLSHLKRCWERIKNEPPATLKL